MTARPAPSSSESHRPDSPFGCGETWGAVLYGIADGRLHICNLDHHHGEHQCKCGDKS